MQQFRTTDTTAVMILSLTEMITMANPVYHFVFTHVLTNDTVTFDKTTSQDESNYHSRYNQFTINPLLVFADKMTGEWHLTVYENSVTGEILQKEKLMLLSLSEFEFAKYNQPTSFKTYNG